MDPSFHKFAQFVSKVYIETPVFDRWLGLLGAAVMGFITLADASILMTIMVGFSTVMMFLPRILIGWIDFKDRLRAERERRAGARRDAMRHIEEAINELESCGSETSEGAGSETSEEK